MRQWRGAAEVPHAGVHDYAAVAEGPAAPEPGRPLGERQRDKDAPGVEHVQVRGVSGGGPEHANIGNVGKGAFNPILDGYALEVVAAGRGEPVLPDRGHVGGERGQRHRVIQGAVGRDPLGSVEEREQARPSR